MSYFAIAIDGFSCSSVALFVLPAVVTLCLLTVTYRLYIHPLARFPGPRVAATSRLYEAYWDLVHGYGGQYTNHIRDLHRRYGPILRINHKEISVDDPDFHEKLYAPSPAVRDKIPMISNILGTTTGTFGTIDSYVHRKRRAASGALFSVQNVLKADKLIRKHVEVLTEKLAASITTQEVFELRVTFMALKLDIFFDFAFADSLCLQQEPLAAAAWDETMQAISVCAPYAKLFPWILPLALKIPIPVLHALSPPLAQVLRINHRIHQQAFNYAENPAKFIGDKGDRPMTLFQILLESGLPEVDKAVSRISQEGAEMFAASGTTARVMWACMYYLHEQPSALASLQQELDQRIPDATVIPPTRELAQFSYMNAVIRESLRLAAPVATRLPLVARIPLEYQSWVIPPGTPISVNSRDLLHNPLIFREPQKFKPERWLLPDEPIAERYFVPFNKGTRMCMGKEFAMSELQVAVAMLIRRFTFELVDTLYERDVEVVRDCFLSEVRPGSRGVKVRVTGIRD